MSNYSQARFIRPHERDAALRLEEPQWSPGIRGWALPDESASPEGVDEGTYLWREIVDEGGRHLAAPLWEAALRFPSSPIHGVHRLHETQVRLPASENMHTLRVLSLKRPTEPPDSIYLLLNGLNESNGMGFYYQLASQLLASQPDGQTSVCILRPFPGHMTRFPFSDFAEKPLDRYLADGSHLFRQYLRYMVETQWLLSALVTRSRYWCPSGAALLAGRNRKAGSRLSTETLSAAIMHEWECQYRASAEIMSEVLAEQSPTPLKPLTEELLGQMSDAIMDSIRSLRSVLRWEQYAHYGAAKPQPELESAAAGRAGAPAIHVLGYSLGGFTAQSMLMAWPFAISSCTAMLSGGALRDLAPTAFAHPEEWQTVLHSLRYELDHLMSSGRFREEAVPRQPLSVTDADLALGPDELPDTPDDDPEEFRIAGVPSPLFRSLHRVFYEVFEQEYRGSYQTRLTEYGSRTLFIVGGSDRIVKTQNVLDSAPADGMNLVEVAGLGHFLGSDGAVERESVQNTFWIPEIARLVRRFADMVAASHLPELAANWLLPDQWVAELGPLDDGPQELTEEERLAVGEHGALSSPLAERFLDDMVARLRENDHSSLFILRNEIPTALLPPALVLRRGLNIHHDNGKVRAYAKGVISRGVVLTDEVIEQVSFVIPASACRILRKSEAVPGMPSQSETPVGYLPWKVDAEAAIRHVRDRADALNARSPLAVRSFSAGIIDAGGEFEAGLGTVLAVMRDADPRAPITVTALPDCWIWLDESVAPPKLTESVVHAFCSWAAKMKRDKETLGKLLAGNRVRIVKLSPARFNPRLRAQLVLDPIKASSLLLHSALCLAASQPGIPPEHDQLPLLSWPT